MHQHCRVSRGDASVVIEGFRVITLFRMATKSRTNFSWYRRWRTPPPRELAIRSRTLCRRKAENHPARHWSRPRTRRGWRPVATAPMSSRLRRSRCSHPPACVVNTPWRDWLWSLRRARAARRAARSFPAVRAGKGASVRSYQRSRVLGCNLDVVGGAASAAARVPRMRAMSVSALWHRCPAQGTNQGTPARPTAGVAANVRNDQLTPPGARMLPRG